MKYGELEILNFDVEKDLEIWENVHQKNYTINVTLPEFTALCPRSGYPDFATLYLSYTPDKFVVELKALKLFINTYRNKSISHENVANEIFDTVYNKIKPKWMKLKADFYPRGNVHTVIEIDSNDFK
ncbi:preQ(1) synthase [Arcobacter sp. FWKO B]|uniref:preQ(1) synthase n=1 Tax=Arcobacter sp. FWKO B TaxID=2593672 RepID=UPI0018A4C57B|nr:preQ(1) synthase [Arcobacter sp. FWKO B]QOG12273.1 NADPH-dependent 7-cyano-7-deazaguanine reductase QueF [Arcobacter sp. FWKO B]